MHLNPRHLAGKPLQALSDNRAERSRGLHPSTGEGAGQCDGRVVRDGTEQARADDPMHVVHSILGCPQQDRLAEPLDGGIGSPHPRGQLRCLLGHRVGL